MDSSGRTVRLPIRTLIDPPNANRRPDSVDPRVVVRGDASRGDGFEGEGGWAVPRGDEDYGIVMRQWRSQSPYYEHKKPESSVAVIKTAPGETT